MCRINGSTPCLSSVFSMNGMVNHRAYWTSQQDAVSVCWSTASLQKGAGLSIGGRFPADWKEYKKVIVMPEFKKDARLLIWVSAVKGVAEFADIKLEAVTDSAK